MRRSGTPADEYYRAARQAVIEAVSALPPGKRYTTPEGARLGVNRKTAMRVFLMEVHRLLPGENGWTTFSFVRDRGPHGGRVILGGASGIPLREALARGEQWASRGELEELAAQIRAALPV